MMAVWFDSHCHLDFPAFDGDRRDVFARAEAEGVREFFVPGTERERWGRLIELRSAAAGVCIGFGLHPYFLHRCSRPELEQALAELPKQLVVHGAAAVGECGLDRICAERGEASLERQSEVLTRQLEVAVELGLPVVLHVVRAHGLMLEVLRRFGRLASGGVIHSYSGSTELVASYRKLNLMFGVGGAVSRDRAHKLRAAVAAMPLESIVLETDAPDQPPVGYAERNEPQALPRIGRIVAALKSLEVEQLAELTTANARRLYQLSP